MILSLLLIGIGVGLIVEIIAVGASARSEIYVASSSFGAAGAVAGSFLPQFVDFHGSQNMGVLVGAVFGATVLAYWNLRMWALVDNA